MDANATAFDLLKEELENDDVHIKINYQTQIKVNAIHRLSIVLANMTPEKIISDLIPYLLSNKIFLKNRNAPIRRRRSITSYSRRTNQI